MEKRKKILFPFIITFIGIFVIGCTVSYRFNGAMVDYNTTKTITINYFPNRARYVYPPLSQDFTQGLLDIFTRQTRLSVVPRDGDIQIDGEITGYDLQNTAIGSDAYATETRLTITVKVHYTDRNNPSQDLEQTFSAQRTFPNTQMLTDVQAELATEMVEELADMIFNATIGRW